jgi:hypothetical protein
MPSYYTMKMMAVCSSEMLVTICEITQCHSAEDTSHNIHCHENLMSLWRYN